MNCYIHEVLDLGCQDGLVSQDDPPPAPVPEPSTLFILGAALILAYLAHRWCRRHASRR